MDDITESVIGCTFRVGKVLGSGFLEKVYENALAHELRRKGHAVVQQAPIEVWYDDLKVGDYFADLLVDAEILVELKATQAIDEVHMAQCMNYLRRRAGMSAC